MENCQSVYTVFAVRVQSFMYRLPNSVGCAEALEVTWDTGTKQGLWSDLFVEYPGIGCYDSCIDFDLGSKGAGIRYTRLSSRLSCFPSR